MGRLKPGMDGSPIGGIYDVERLECGIIQLNEIMVHVINFCYHLKRKEFMG